MNRQVKQHKYIDSFTSMVLTDRKIADTVNSRQHQGISVLSHKKSRTIFVVQYGSDVFCSGITKNSENFVLGIFLSKPQAWHIIAARSAVHIITRQRASYLRLDDIQCFALMIYRRQAADDIHASRRDLLRTPLHSPRFCGIMRTER